MCGLSFECDRVRVVLSDSVEPHHHTQALEAVLGQLKELRVVEATDRTADGTYVYSEADAVVSALKEPRLSPTCAHTRLTTSRLFTVFTLQPAHIVKA